MGLLNHSNSIKTQNIFIFHNQGDNAIPLVISFFVVNFLYLFYSIHEVTAMKKVDTQGLTKAQIKEKIRERYKGLSSDLADVIPARKQQDFYDEEAKRVAVYVRVSTDNIQQTSSYELQKNYYEDMVERHENWTLVEIYADEGISGTSLNKREAFNRMIADCKAGKIDMIITKSVSRFARNIVDCVTIVRMLNAQRPPVGVFFETEHIFTLKDNSEMSLNFTATMAQEESHVKSSIMNASIEMRFSHGILLTPVLLGYDHDEEKHLVVNEDEAKIVRLIFFLYLFGYTCQEIADTLTELGAETKRGNTTWNAGSILQILRNERYCGDVLTRKTFTPSYLDHKSRKNQGDRTQHRWKDRHEAIISRDDFIAVQHLINNAKYGNKGILPELQVIKEGALKGFVSVNPRWSGFTAEDYLDACLSAYGDEPQIDADSEPGPEKGELDLRGFEIARSQFFDLKNRLTVRFTQDKVTFGKACLAKFNNAQYVELLVDPLHHLLAVRVSSKENRNAIPWVRLDQNGTYQPKTLSGTAFLSTFYELFDWDTQYKYRVSGIRRQQGNEAVLVFDMDETEVFMPEDTIDTEDSEVDDDLLPNGRNSIIAYPSTWAHSFGANYYAQARELAAFVADGTWQLSEQAEPYSTTELKVTAPSVLKMSIDQLMDEVRQNGNQEDE